jgi:catechol 2,3-dioxygenase-like lactoylglutathione lyase family enzyme
VADTARSAAFYRDAFGAEIVWAFDRFGAVVAALQLGDGPLLLLADHRPPGECRLLYAVDDLGAAVRAARAAGAHGVVEVGVPPGPCAIFDDAGGNPVGVIEETRAGRMEEAFRHPDNDAALRPPWPDSAIST